MDTPLTSTGWRKAVAPSADNVETVFSMPSGVRLGSSKDYLVHREGRVYAGTHILIDFWSADGLDDRDFVETALREAAIYADATVLHVHVHKFGEGDGVSGVAVLAESHISIHTWPEIGLAALDVFMCGACRPELAVAHLERRFKPDRVERREYQRGLIE